MLTSQRPISDVCVIRNTGKFLVLLLEVWGDVSVLSLKNYTLIKF